MPADRRQQQTNPPPVQASARSPTVLASIGLTLLLAVSLALPPARAMAANAQTTLLQPSGSGKLKTTRQALLKGRTTLLGLGQRHPGRSVGGTRAPPPKTIVTKRFLPN